ncbi:flagellar basal-body rod protein FlgB [Paracoccus halophilus]|uniref:Flagellar basal body rod protein FlgB n=1 Tax=Paracoccus halophilus TaxID=376733 RepID=A0A099F814_9RHOB|nr:FlgB family protein [Paracoccus halophilus]KGJ06629.1 flagellar basal body rod protein FlgB [Paracoccus halophilus]SFA42587.1 flagellar basal-body rod protein FlgB [Paracoccus halophilus]
MLERIGTLKMAGALTEHAVQRQKLIAQNVANADTPGFRARDLSDFADTYRSQVSAGMRATRPNHVTGISWGGGQRIQDTGGESAPNGNTVSVEDEMFRIASARREFDLSLTVTRSAMSLIRTSIGRRG